MKTLRGAGLSVLIALVLYVTVVSGIDAEAVQAAVIRLGWWGWGVILALSLVNYALRFARWHHYLRLLGHAVPLGRDLTIYVAGFAMTTTPGKAGEAVRCVYLRPFGVGYGHSLAALFTERFSDLLAMLVLAVLGLLTFGRYTLVLVAALAVMAGILFIIQRPELVSYLHSRGRRGSDWLSALARQLVGPLRASSSLLRTRPLYLGLMLGVVSWGAEGVALFLIAQVLEFELGLALAIGIYAISILVGALSFIPGGLGSTEATMGLLLTLHGTDASLAVAATIITRVATLWFAVVLGTLAFAGLELMGGEHYPHARLR